MTQQKTFVNYGKGNKGKESERYENSQWEEGTEIEEEEHTLSEDYAPNQVNYANIFRNQSDIWNIFSKIGKI